MPVDFLSDDVVAKYGRFHGPPSRMAMEKLFFLDDADLKLINRRRQRGDHVRLGFALQLTTVRYLGTFLADPLDVPIEVVDVLAAQLDIADPSCVKRYTERRNTRFEHAEEIRKAGSLTHFSEVEDELTAWVDARAWMFEEGPTAIFHGAVKWLAERRVLLPGISTLTRLIAHVREQAIGRLWEALNEVLTSEQRRVLVMLLEIQPGMRMSDLERWRIGPARASGPEMVKALKLVREISAAGFGKIELGAQMPRRRLAELARYGMGAKPSQLKRHPEPRKLATLLATVRHLEAKAVDDALELLDLLEVEGGVVGDRPGGAQLHLAARAGRGNVVLLEDQHGELGNPYPVAMTQLFLNGPRRIRRSGPRDRRGGGGHGPGQQGGHGQG
ncbi:DUF4158 domain-containing protein [Streptosporangium subroseum]|uniref:DUF4158 domain-containing protein n=1 Tax=Streptosporangium subroseum TaxID=106412 RepID=UPI0034236F30